MAGKHISMLQLRERSDTPQRSFPLMESSIIRDRAGYANTKVSVFRSLP